MHQTLEYTHTGSGEQGRKFLARTVIWSVIALPAAIVGMYALMFYDIQSHGIRGPSPDWVIFFGHCLYYLYFTPAIGLLLAVAAICFCPRQRTAVLTASLVHAIELAFLAWYFFK